LRRIRLAAAARRELADALRFLSERNPQAARELAARIADAQRLVAERPGIGARHPDADCHLWQIPGTPYRLVYRLEAEHLLILRIWHGARGWPPAS
jgi:plasmid stabilization system protein ParE